MRIRKRLLLAAGVVLASSPAAMVGCVGDDNAAPGAGDSGAPFDGSTPHQDATTDSPAPPQESGADVGTDSSPEIDSALPDAGPPTAKLRIAWLRPDDPNQATLSRPAPRRARRLPEWAPSTASGYDVCIRPHGTTQWQGPLLATAGERFTQGDVTQYQTVIAGQYDARIVEQTVTVGVDAGTITCDDVPTDLADGGTTDYTSLPAIPAGKALTIVFTRAADTSVSEADVFALVDETTTTSGKAKIRYVNGSTITGPTDYGLSGGVSFAPLFTNVTEVQHIDPNADANGYVEIDPVASIDTSIFTNGSDILSTPSVSLAAGQIMTTFAMPVPGEGFVYGLLNCMDGVDSTDTPLLTQCTLTSNETPNHMAKTRVADFIADTGFQNVDVCFKHASLSKYAPPVLLSRGLDAGVAFAEVSPYFSLHGGFSYGVRFVAPGTTDCNTATPAAPDGTYAAPVGIDGNDSATTMALTGYVTAPTDAGFTTLDGGGATSTAFALLAFRDVDFNNEESPSARVINLAANNVSQPIGVSFPWTSGLIAYGAANAPDLADGGAPIGHGYALLPQEYANTEMDLTSGGLYTFSDNPESHTTFFLYSGQLNAVNVLECGDDDGTTSGLWSCTDLGPFFNGS